MSGEPVDWKQECAELQKRVNLLLSSLVALSLIVTVFIFVQYWRTSKDLELDRPVGIYVTEANRKEGPAIEKFINTLAAYSKSHPDFATNLAKMGIQLGTNPAAQPSSAATPGLDTPPISTPTK